MKYWYPPLKPNLDLTPKQKIAFDDLLKNLIDNIWGLFLVPGAAIMTSLPAMEIKSSFSPPDPNEVY